MIHKLIIEIDTETVDEANSIAVDIEQTLTGRDVVRFLDKDMTAMPTADVVALHDLVHRLHYGLFTGPNALQQAKDAAGPLWAKSGAALERARDESNPMLPFPHAKNVKVRPVVPGDADDKRLIEKAREKWARDGEIEIDDDAVVSRGGDPGAYVAAWVWVYDPALNPDHDGDEDHLKVERDEDMLLRHLDVGHGIDPNTHEVGADLEARHQNEHEGGQ